MPNFIKDNGGILVLLVFVVGIGAAYLEWRVAENTEAAVNDAGGVTPDQLAEVQSQVKEVRSMAERNDEDIDKLEDNDKRFDDKIDRIVDILLED